MVSHGSLVICNNRWYWNRGGFGGISALYYLVKAEGIDFVCAVEAVNGIRAAPSFHSLAVANPALEHDKKLVLPPCARYPTQLLPYLQSMQSAHLSEWTGKAHHALGVDKPYFPATDCAKILGYARPENAISRHCKGSLKRGVLSNGGFQEKKFIPEGDLYRLIIRSKLPSAERFEKLVFDEILPTIRKHGAYATADTLDELLRNPEL